MEPLGVRDLFTLGSANLFGISNERLYASKGVHQAYIEVNEVGTEAAAAATAPLFLESYRGHRLFLVNRPFLFIVYDFEHKATLFAGKLVDPNILWLGSSRS